MTENQMRVFDALSVRIKSVSCDEKMRDHISFRVGGPAEIYIEPENIEEIKAAIRILKEYHMPYYLIGNGSNLLVSEKGLKNAIIKIGDKMNRIEMEDQVAVVESGALLSTLSKAVAKIGLTGLEFASGIPGAVGGAVAMNAGAYGGEMKDVVKWVEVLDENLEVVRVDSKEMQFGYRHSLVESRSWIVLKCAVQLQKGEQAEIDSKMAELAAKRKAKQPLHLPSAGSTFKRPEGHFAAKLIEDAGLKGYSIGDAQVSPLHCGFVVNNGNATASEVYALIKYVQQTVYDKFNVHLETEVKLLGEF